MILTKDERHKLYKKMLEYSEHPALLDHPTNPEGGKRMTNENGLCFMAKLLTGSDIVYDTSICLPELSQFENEKWWGEYLGEDRVLVYKPRIAALKQCILETHP